MDLVRNIISLGRNAREEAKIKVRQPLQAVILDGKYQSILDDLQDLIKEELNIKEVIFAQDLTPYMNFTIKHNFKEAGKIFGSKMKDYSNYLANLKEEDIVAIENGKSYEFEGVEVTKDLVDIRINSKEGFNTVLENSTIC